jgi:short subunit dehydrogenase-like uncharacterized protein
MTTQTHDLVVFGATSFVGRILSHYLIEQFGSRGELKWAAAGRSLAKLEALRAELGPKAAKLPLIVADAADEAALSQAGGAGASRGLHGRAVRAPWRAAGQGLRHDRH